MLAQVPGCDAATPPDAITVLRGGTINTSFRVDTRAGRFVLRLNARAGGLVGADHEREAQLQRVAAQFELAPPLLYADAAQGFMISKYIDGRVWRPSDMQRPAALRRLGTRLRALHDVAPPAVAAFDLGALLRGYCRRVGDAVPAERPLLAGLQQRSEATLAMCMAGGRRATIVHNDLHHSNLIEADRLYLIDWEYAAVADPLFDLACVLAYYPQAEPHAQALLDAAGLAEQASVAACAA